MQRTIFTCAVRLTIVVALIAAAPSGAVAADPQYAATFGAVALPRILVNRLGYGGIRWTVDTLGWQGSARDQSIDTVVARVIANLRPGAIVLMHVGAAEDGTTLDAAALTRVIAEVRARGYEFVTLRDFLW